MAIARRSLAILQLKDLPNAPATKQLVESLKATDKDRDGAVSFTELARLDPRLRAAAADLFAPSEPSVAAVEPARPLSEGQNTSARYPTDAELKDRHAPPLVQLTGRTMPFGDWQLRVLARTVEVKGGRHDEVKAFALAFLRKLDPHEVEFGNPSAVGALKRLATAVGLRPAEVLVEFEKGRFLPLQGFERVQHLSPGVSIAEVLANPATRTLGLRLLDAELDSKKKFKDGYLTGDELRALPRSTQDEVGLFLESTRPVQLPLLAEQPGPISTRAATRGESLAVQPQQRLRQLKDLPDQVLSNPYTLQALYTAVTKSDDLIANPYMLRALARVCELGSAIIAKELDPAAKRNEEELVAGIKKGLAKTLTSGFLTPLGLANAAARTSLEIVLRAAKAAGVDAQDVRVTVGGGARLTLKQLEGTLGELDLVPVVEGPAHPPFDFAGANAIPSRPKPTFTPDPPSLGPSIGGAPVMVLDDSFWEKMWSVINLPDWSYFGSPNAGVEYFPNITNSPVVAGGGGASSPPVAGGGAPSRGRVTGYVNPWTMLADHRASSYFAAVAGGYRDGWLQFIATH